MTRSPEGPSSETLKSAMRQALALARQAALEDEVPVGAVILHAGQVIGSGANRRETANDPTAHAEMIAIVEAARGLKSWRLVGCTLVVTLEPCPMCLAACQQARIESVVYGAVDPKGGALSLGYKLNEDVRTNHRFAVKHEDEPECARVLRDFFAAKRAGK